jgi:hypothetical protein
MTYRPGDFLRICDRTGFKVWASDTQEEWNGLIVKKGVYEARHPQDFVKGRVDQQAVKGARPRPGDLAPSMPYVLESEVDGDGLLQDEDNSALLVG